MSYFYCVMAACLFLCNFCSHRWVSGFAARIGHGLWPCQIDTECRIQVKIYDVSCLHLHNYNNSILYTRTMQQGFHFRRLNSAHVCDIWPLLLFSILQLQIAADRHLHVSATAACYQSNNTHCIQSLKLLIQTFQRSDSIRASAKSELSKDFWIPVRAGNQRKKEAERLTPLVSLNHDRIAPNNSQNSHKEPRLERPIFHD